MNFVLCQVSPIVFILFVCIFSIIVQKKKKKKKKKKLYKKHHRNYDSDDVFLFPFGMSFLTLSVYVLKVTVKHTNSPSRCAFIFP